MPLIPQSTDEKNNTLDTKLTFFVYVDDVADNSPFFTDVVPFYTLEECKTEVSQSTCHTV